MGAEQLIASGTQNGEIKLKSLVDIAGQNFIVTGAAKGIGLAISSLFNSLGAKVSGWDLDDAGMKNNPVLLTVRLLMSPTHCRQEGSLPASQLLVISMALLQMLG